MKTLLLSASLLCAGVLFARDKDKNKDKAKTAQTTDTVKKATPAPPAKPSIKDKVKSSKKIDGLFTMYQDTATGSLQMYVKKDQLGTDYIYQSFSMGGPVSMFLNQNMIRATWIFKIEKKYDKLEFLQQNTSFYYDKDNAVSKAENVDVPDAVFYADKVVAEDSTGYLVAVDGLFMGDKLDPVKPLARPGTPPGAVFSLGNLNPSKSNYDEVRSFDNNTDILVNLAYDNPMPFNGGGKDITDARYVRVKMQHSFIEMPKNDFKPRRDDPRVGFFGQEVDNLTSISVTPYKDIINRWNLVKKDPNAAISEPVTPIVYWIENTTPVEYRSIIKEAGEKWNEAFEQAGFKNAVVMKIMPDDATWDPADINYNVIRWVSSATPAYGAIGPSFVNPLTGQILGADITVEWRSGAGTPVFDDLFNGGTTTATNSMPWNNPEVAMYPEEGPKFQFDKNHLANCSLAQGLSVQYQSGIAAIETLDGDLPETNRAKEVAEMHKQFLYYLILHEMGHTLGLMHNMKATQMLSPAQLNDINLTHKVGLQGSVMDYPSINVSLDRSKQGDYYTTKCGPYDLWAIQYGYTPFSPAEEEAGLNAILAKSNEFGHMFGNDADDMRSSARGIDPRVNIYDMSNDMVTYADDRFKLVNTMMPKLKSRFAQEGQSYQLLRARYGQLMNQRAQMTTALSRYIGGVEVDRSFVGQETSTQPFTPVPEAYQKKAMALIAKYVLAPNAFDADAYLLPYLQLQRRGFDNIDDIKPQSNAMSLQMTALTHLLHPTTLMRINNSSLYGNTYSCAEVMDDLVKNIMSADLKTNVNLYRQNLQTEFVNALISISGAKSGYDNASSAAALYSLKKVKGMLSAAVSTDEQTKAHRSNLNFMIDKALAVK